MKSYLPVLLLLGLLTQACKREEYAQSDLNKPFSLAKGESRELALDGSFTSHQPIGEKLTFRLVDLTDSRCPANAYCIWAGEARTAAELELGGQKGQAVLKLGGDRKSALSDSVRVGVGAYSFTVLLRDVTPLPGTAEASKATFVVRW